MDRIIEKKKWPAKRIFTIVGAVAIIALIGFSYFSISGKTRLNVKDEQIIVGEVKKGPFQEFIPINGVVQPITTIYMDAVEGGRVEQKFVEDGAVVKAGQPILKLANTDLELDLANRETAVYDLITNMQNTRNLADQNSIRQLNQLADVDNALAEAERKYKMNKTLYDEKVVSFQEFKSVENEYNYQLRRKKLTLETLKKDTLANSQQFIQQKQSLMRMQNALMLMRKKAEDLTVKAPVDGQLTSLDAEIGQSKNKGERLGQIDVLSGFKVRADIDEHYISRVFTGLDGEFVFNNETYKLKVKKVYSQVSNGRFQVDMEFVGSVPKGVRRGQTLQIRLALGDETQALLLPKGGFYQQTGGNWIFKVSADGKTAYKVDIQLGRQNPDYYEVLGGLQPGDKVVTSSYENYGEIQELNIGH
ncbi:HlyD family efflux transporter periplasmic adaptor subunit [Solitalea sp. MAHUQ-68]|uniref:HlyD family efflux transporter periplasmic adaptor subunit n=1 Tax=Solitalea agri TaxID=2953739 RepID=A0A9X2EZD0_9SPHI|nr:HlyD family efflux transporter periplasmic adaptor subunit [Solitalea agri]MCO4291842.1 HlyD family efflux transporter periplasmic adaptor subunit [Solitalea agri]